MSAGHSHDHDHRAASRKRLAIAFVFASLYMAAEVVGGLVANSLALLADAGHMLSDSVALGLALFATWMASRPPTARRTYGYHRAEILAALANGATLLAVAGWIVVEAVDRLRHPPEVAGGLMMAIAAGGLLVNGAMLLVLRGGRDESLNVRGAWLHVLTDTLGSVQAIVAGGLILWLGWSWADPLASILIAALVVYSAWGLVRETVSILMESVPAHLHLHDLHVWTVTSGFVALSTHIEAAPPLEEALLWQVRAMLRERFEISHSTIQLESCQRPQPIVVPRTSSE